MPVSAKDWKLLDDSEVDIPTLFHEARRRVWAWEPRPCPVSQVRYRDWSSRARHR